jgi:hypothetical protein
MSKGTPGLDFSTVASLCDVSGWLKFLGILNIVAGVIYCCTIFGAVFGWIPIWIGVLLNNAGNSLRAGYDGQNAGAIYFGIDRLALAIKIIGILTLIGLIINVLVVVGYVIIIILIVGVGVSSSM